MCGRGPNGSTSKGRKNCPTRRVNTRGNGSGSRGTSSRYARRVQGSYRYAWYYATNYGNGHEDSARSTSVRRFGRIKGGENRFSMGYVIMQTMVMRFIFPNGTRTMNGGSAIVRRNGYERSRAPSTRPCVMAMGLNAKNGSTTRVHNRPSGNGAGGSKVNTNTNEEFFVRLSIYLPPILSTTSLRKPTFLLLLCVNGI